MAVSDENRLVRRSAGDAVGQPLSAKTQLRKELFEVVEIVTGEAVGSQVETERMLVATNGERTGWIEVSLRAAKGLHEQATLIVHGSEKDIYVDLSDNPTEIPHGDALAATEIMSYLQSECAGTAE